MNGKGDTPTQEEVQSFEVAEGNVFGDLLSHERITTESRLKIGVLATGYFEYWRMYPGLRARIENDMQVVCERLAQNHDTVSSALVDTMDEADEAGRMFKAAGVDVLILAYRSYIPDAYVHQLLSHLPGIPLLVFASQSRDSFDYTDDYSGVLRNSGLMAQVQLICGIRRMGDHSRSIDCVAGSIYDDEAYRKIDRYIRVATIHKRLKTMTIGVIGQVFRGMFDFEYDKTVVKGALGPEIINLQIDHLLAAWEQAEAHDPDVREMIRFARTAYCVQGVGDDDLERAARVAVALRRLVLRFRLDGLAMLCQHFVERKLKTTPYLGLSDLHRRGFACAAEGDVIGLIMMKILQHLTGNMPFFVEWSEFDVELNAWMLLGHGFGDASQARSRRPLLVPSAEQWGLEGTGCSLCFVPLPGRCTMAHFVQCPDGWRMVVSGGEILDLDPLPIHDVHAMVRVEKPIKEYTEELVLAGVPHHAVTVRGDVRAELQQLARMLEMQCILL